MEKKSKKDQKVRMVKLQSRMTKVAGRAGIHKDQNKRRDKKFKLEDEL